MQAGTLDRRITLQRPESSRDAQGEPVPAWADVADVWAHRRPVRAAERFAAQQVIASNAVVFRIRYRADVVAAGETWRIVDRDGIWGIEGVAEIGRRDGLELAATRRAA